MNGSLRLRADVRDGRTVLVESQGTYPVQVVRPHAGPASGGLSLVVLLLSGGLLDGDELDIDVEVEAGARLALRTQAATQAHAGRSRQTLSATVCERAWFSYLPHALVPHANADVHSRTLVRMQPDSRVLVSETLAPGRPRFGELFAYRQVRLDLDVWCTSDLLARERAVIRPDPLARGAQFGPATHTAGVYQLGPRQAPLGEVGDAAYIGCTPLARGGWHLRASARRAATIDQILERLGAAWWGT